MLHCGNSYAQNIIPSFKHLNSSNGMSANSAICLYKDMRGFLWVGTKSGLNRFDGKNIMVLQHKEQDSTSIINNHIMDICEDNRGMIWVATHGGLSMLDPYSNKFTNYKKIYHLKDTIDFSTGTVSVGYFKNKIWIGTTHGIYNTKIDSVKFICIDSSTLHNQPQKIRCLPNRIHVYGNTLWINTFSGLYYTIDGKNFYSRYYNPNKLKILSMGYIPAFYYDGDSVAWFGTWSFDGIYKYNLKKNKLDSFEIKTTKSLNYLCITKVSDNELWATSISSGIICFNTKTKEGKLYLPDKTNPRSVSDIAAEQVMCDEQGTVFVATERGLDYINMQQTHFSISEHRPGNKFSLPDDAIMNMLEDNAGDIWIGSQKTGLYKMNKEGDIIEHYDMSKLFGKNYNEVWTIYLEQNKLWLSGENGLVIFDLKTKQFSRLNGLPSEVAECLDGWITEIYKDEYGNYWLSLWQNGLLKYNFTTKEYIHYSPDNPEHKLPYLTPQGRVVDKRGNVWIGYMEIAAFTCFDITKNTFKNYSIEFNSEGINNRSLMGLEFDNMGQLWLATLEGGIYCFDPTKETFKSFDIQKGLSSNKIYGIIKDLKNNLWAISIHGLNRINISTGEISNYYISDGLPSNDFGAAPHMITQKGILYFVCDQSIVKLNPDELKPNPYTPSVYLMSYEVSGITRYIENGQTQLNFSYHDKTIIFEFNGINYIDPDKTQYAYFMDGFDEVWTYSGSRNFASYTNLPRGDYILRIKTSNKPNQWNMKEYTIKIHVDGPFWKTWWFFGLCLLLMCLISYIIYFIRLRQILAIQNIRNKISQDLHDDIGSSLSSISIYSEVLKKIIGNKVPDSTSIITNLQETAKNAMENMSDIVWAINPKHDRFVNITDRLEIFANQLLGAKNITFNFKIPNDIGGIKLSTQQRKNIYLICKEAVNNVAKYSDAKNCIVEILKNENNMSIHIIDDGKGMGEESKSLGGNGMLNMKKRANELDGVLDVVTEKNKGTKLSISFML